MGKKNFYVSLMLVALALFSALISGCSGEGSGSDASSEDVVVAGPDSQADDPSGQTSASFTVHEMDWGHSLCDLEGECERRSNQKSFNVACARVIYSADADMLCHLYINKKLRIDDPMTLGHENIGRVHRLSAGQDKIRSLDDDNFPLFYDTRVEWCCVPEDQPEKIKEKDYDICEELVFKKYCEG
ncbi:hypothetical protein GF351_01670 [Candidatus Woesearchaeota archaeon]|nr:hypothetical protein [Candidatus Woesearchaeota archaeon]